MTSQRKDPQDPIWVLIRKELGSELRRVREERGGLTHQEVADRSGVGRRTISNLERGDNTNIDNYIRVALALDLEWGWLSQHVMALLEVRQETERAPTRRSERSTG